MEINTVVTLTDWTSIWGTWGIPCIRCIIEKCAKASIKKIYWRIFNGGKAMYPSKLAEPQIGIDLNTGI